MRKHPKFDIRTVDPEESIKELCKRCPDCRARIEEIEGDERLYYPAAKVQVNTPLALQQIAMKAKLEILKWILDEDEDEKE